MYNKLSVLVRTLVGNLLKVSFFIDWKLNKNIKKSTCRADQVVVSLTSYGERVSKSAALVVYSLMKQSVQPDKIVLWLDENKWNKDVLPNNIKYLIRNGLEVRFCKDLRSFTKLIPALKEFPQKCIITVDDDVFYSPQMIYELFENYKKNPKSVSCLHFCIVDLDKSGTIKPYYEWEECHVVSIDREINERYIFPQGYGGVLYPPNVFDECVLDYDTAQKLSPFADDVWFYCMGLKNGAKRSYPCNSKTKYYLIDMFRQLIKKDRLNEMNVKLADKNGEQLVNVLKHYNISINE